MFGNLLVVSLFAPGFKKSLGNTGIGISTVD